MRMKGSAVGGMAQPNAWWLVSEPVDFAAARIGCWCMSERRWGGSRWMARRTFSAIGALPV